MVRTRRLSPAEMDRFMDEAAAALGRLPEDVVKAVANWWNQWYGFAGHRRLGRLLLTRKSQLSSQKEGYGVDDRNRRGLNDELRGRIIDEGLRYTLTEAPLDSPPFFAVREIAGEVRIVLNSAHPACKLITSALDGAAEQNAGDLNSPPNGSEGIVLLLKAWADVERHQPDGERKHRIQEAREDWGRVARDLLATPKG